MNSRLPIYFEKKHGTIFSYSYQKIGITVVLTSKHRIKHQYSLIKRPSINYPTQSQVYVTVLCSKMLNHTSHIPNKQNFDSFHLCTSCVRNKRFQRKICQFCQGSIHCVIRENLEQTL